jgi:hypothetical protein
VMNYEAAVASGLGRISAKDAKFAQKLGHLQPFIAGFSHECMGQLAYFGPTFHLSHYCRFAPPLIRFIPYSLGESVLLFLKR